MPGISAFDTTLLMSDMVARAIHAAIIATDSFEIVGDVTLLFTNGVAFRVTGSTGNDGRYYCHGDSTFGAGDTTIHCTTDVLDATADGNIYLMREVANVTNLTGPALSADTIDVTSHDSGAVPWEEIVPSFIRSGDVTLEINYDPSEVTHDGTDGLPAVLEARGLADYEIVWPFPVIGGTTWTFSGYVTSFEPSAPFDGKISASVTIKVDGPAVLV